MQFDRELILLRIKLGIVLADHGLNLILNFLTLLKSSQCSSMLLILQVRLLQYKLIRVFLLDYRELVKVFFIIILDH